MIGEIEDRQNLSNLVDNGGFQFSDTFFPYTSGEIGPYYVKSEVVTNDSPSFQLALDSMETLIAMNIEGVSDFVIAGGESRDWIFSFPMSDRLKTAHTAVYKNGKMHGSNVKDRNVVWVADLNNEGSSPRDLWVPAIKKAGGILNHIFFYVDRMESGVQVMKNLKLKSHAVVSLDESAWDYLKQNDIVTEQAYKNLRERGQSKESRDAWAISMLRSDAGFTTFKELYDNPKTEMKAAKILDTAYRSIRGELMERLAA